MNELQETIWRKALQAKGKDWVARKLSYPGVANDPVLDVVFEEPLPTRAFCQKWCAEEDNKLYVPSKGTIIAIFLVVVLLGSMSRVVSSLENQPQHQQPNFAAIPGPVSRD